VPRLRFKTAVVGDVAATVTGTDFKDGELALSVDPLLQVGEAAQALSARGSGWRLEAEYAFASSWASRSNTTTVQCKQWSAVRGKRAARFWMCEASCSLPPAPGNLNVVIRRKRKRFSGTRGHFFLHARYDYVILNVKKGRGRVRILIDLGADRALDFVALRADLLALQFALGTGIRIASLTGVDVHGKVVGVANYALGSTTTGARVEWPVPSAHELDTWSAPFCERICEVDKAHPELRLRIPLSFYVAAIYAPLLELRYLLFQIATEALAFWYLKSEGVDEVEIVDKTVWRAWTKAHADELRGLALDDMGEILFKNVQNARRHASGRNVAKVFQLFKTTLPSEIVDEISDGRGAMIHQATMFDEPQDSADQYVRRVAIMRTALVALLARIVGYDGPITGWTAQQRREFEPAGKDWWPAGGVVASPAARRDYLCDVSQH